MDFPDPDGPMTAVVVPAGNCIYLNRAGKNFSGLSLNADETEVKTNAARNRPWREAQVDIAIGQRIRVIERPFVNVDVFERKLAFCGDAARRFLRKRPPSAGKQRETRQN